MAVFTEVPFEEAAAFLRRLGLGELRAMAACHGGIENTNYFVDTDRGEYVLTLFERLAWEQLPFYLHLMQHLASRGVPVPRPAPDAEGRILHRLKGKPAAVVGRLRGKERTGARRPALRRSGRHAGANAPGRQRLCRAPAQPARAAVVEGNRAGSAAIRRRGPAHAAAGRAGLPDTDRRVARLRSPPARTGTCRPVPRQRDVRGPTA